MEEKKRKEKEKERGPFSATGLFLGGKPEQGESEGRRKGDKSYGTHYIFPLFARLTQTSCCTVLWDLDYFTVVPCTV